MKLIVWLVAFFLPVLAALACRGGEPIGIPYEISYAAYESGQPMVIVFGADYCPACHSLAAKLTAARVRFAWWDIQRPPFPGSEYTPWRHGPIPRVIVWSKFRAAITGQFVGDVGVRPIQEAYDAACPPPTTEPAKRIPELPRK